MKIHGTVAAAALCLMATSLGWAHEGRLDSYGCHHDYKAGGYHCHSGKDAGRHFKTKEEAINRPKATPPYRKKTVTKNETTGS